MFLWNDSVQLCINFEKKKTYTTIGTVDKLFSIPKELCNIFGFLHSDLSGKPSLAYPLINDRAHLFLPAKKQEITANQILQTCLKRTIKAEFQIKYNQEIDLYTANIQIDPFYNHKNRIRIVVDQKKQIIFIYESKNSSFQDFKETFQTLYTLSHQMTSPIVIFVKYNVGELDYITRNETARGYQFMKELKKTSGPIGLTAFIRVVDKKIFPNVQFISSINGGLHAIYAPTVNDAVQIADTIHKSNINHHLLKEICIMG